MVLRWRCGGGETGIGEVCCCGELREMLSGFGDGDGDGDSVFMSMGVRCCVCIYSGLCRRRTSNCCVCSDGRSCVALEPCSTQYPLVIGTHNHDCKTNTQSAKLGTQMRSHASRQHVVVELIYAHQRARAFRYMVHSSSSIYTYAKALRGSNNAIPCNRNPSRACRSSNGGVSFFNHAHSTSPPPPNTSPVLITRSETLPIPLTSRPKRHPSSRPTNQHDSPHA